MNEDKKQKIKSFTDLKTWQEGHKLLLMIYKATKQFPKEEQFGLTNQLRRAAVSFTSNVAEGFARRSFKEKAKFYNMSRGSLAEIQNQILAAKDLQYITQEEFQEIADQTIITAKPTNGLIRETRSRIED